MPRSMTASRTHSNASRWHHEPAQNLSLQRAPVVDVRQAILARRILCGAPWLWFGSRWGRACLPWR